LPSGTAFYGTAFQLSIFYLSPQVPVRNPTVELQFPGRSVSRLCFPSTFVLVIPTGFAVSQQLAPPMLIVFRFSDIATG
jgi:hypothetical protein